MENYYRLLELVNYANINEVNKKYNIMIKEYYGKLHLSKDDKQFIKKLNIAKFILTNVDNKNKYDNWLKKQDKYNNRYKRLDNEKLTNRIFDIKFDKKPI
jgi:hypothetical protein